MRPTFVAWVLLVALLAPLGSASHGFDHYRYVSTGAVPSDRGVTYGGVCLAEPRPGIGGDELAVGGICYGATPGTTYLLEMDSALWGDERFAVQIGRYVHGGTSTTVEECLPQQLVRSPELVTMPPGCDALHLFFSQAGDTGKFRISWT